MVLVKTMQLTVSIVAGWAFHRTIGQDPQLTPQAWALGALGTGVGAAYLATRLIVWLRDALRLL